MLNELQEDIDNNQPQILQDLDLEKISQSLSHLASCYEYSLIYEQDQT